MPRPAPSGTDDVLGHDAGEEVAEAEPVGEEVVLVLVLVGKGVAVPVFVRGNTVALPQLTLSPFPLQQVRFDTSATQQENP